MIMIQSSTIRLLSLICFAVSAVILSSCKKDNNGDDGRIVLLSFGPTGAKHGDTLRFIGNHLDKVTAIQFTGNNATVEKNNFISQTGNLILLQVPQAAEKGYVTLKTPQGDIVSKTQLNLGVTATLTSMTLQSRPGENITLNGTYLNWVQRITFTNNKVVENFVSKNFNQIVVKVPDDAQTGPLRIFYGGTDSMEIETDDTLQLPLPTITGMAPNPVKHAQHITITGTDLDLAKKVYFTGVNAPVTNFVSQSQTQLVVQVPGATKKGTLKLEAASGVQTTSTMELDVVLPAVTGMSPNPVDPGANLTITGTNLDLVTSVTFQNAPAVTAFVSQSPTQIVVTVPNGVTQGKITLGVLNSSLVVQSDDILQITGAVPPPVMSFPIYNDAVTSNWNGWLGNGWGGTRDINNITPVREGSKSIRIDYVGGWGSPLQLGGANISLAPFTTFKISIYGGPGTNGKKVNIALNQQDAHTITLVEGQWTDYAIPLSTMTSAATLTEIWVKEFNGTGGFTIYVDALGLN